MAEMYELIVNRRSVQVDAGLGTSLLSVLREQLDLTGAKYGCGEGQCGACTVLVDDLPVRSCLLPARAAVGKTITTIEGLADSGGLHPVQRAFLDADAMQCGYCTPGMIVAAAGLLRQKPSPTRGEIARFMQGNICRCGTYSRILTAVEEAAAMATEDGR